MFISIFKAEVYHKLQPDSNQEPLYTFTYGQSFNLYVIGFVVVELSGILNVCLYNRLQQIADQNQVRLKDVSQANLEISSLNQSHRVETSRKSNFPPFSFLFGASCLSPSTLFIHGCNSYNQNHFQLNNHVKIGLVESEASSNMCQHRVPFPSIVDNG